MREVPAEPVAGRIGCGGEGAGLFEEVGCAGDDDEFVGASQSGLGGTVEVEDGRVVAADDEQRRRPHVGEAWPGKVWAAATGDDGGDVGVGFAGRPQRGCGAGAGAEPADADTAAPMAGRAATR